MSDILTRAMAEALDARDPLAPCRARFMLPPRVLYLDGNSLGAQPATTAGRMARLLQDWERDLIAGWNRHDWIGWPRRLGDCIARLIGAERGEVVVADSTSVNLFKLLAAALDLASGRRTILSEADNFPTDLHVAEGLSRLLGDRVRVASPRSTCATWTCSTPSPRSRRCWRRAHGTTRASGRGRW